MYKCCLCNYFSDRKYNYTRHFNNVHITKSRKNEVYEKVQNVPPKIQNVPPKIQNVPPKIQNVPFEENNQCYKCKKKYRTKRHLINHISKCKGVDELTCPKCMISFTTRQHKYNHLRRNNCKARSIVHARTSSFNNIQNITNNIDNSTNKTINNNIVINNLGSERIDHISNDEILKFLTSGINTIPLYIKKKHFDENFPENNNIIYTNENKCKVMEDNIWIERDLGNLSNTLIKDNTEVLLLYYDTNKEEIGESINNIDILQNLKDKLIVIYNKQDGEKYNHVLTRIKDLIKNFKK
jgi:hypothetical protein